MLPHPLTARHLTFWGYIQAGFPSPAEGYEDHTLDLNEHLVPNPAATFFYHVSGHEMKAEGIHHGAILVVDRSIQPGPGKIAVVEDGDRFTVERLQREPRQVFGCVRACINLFR